MRLQVVTPVGPGHSRKAVEQSVNEAMHRPGRFAEIQHVVVMDQDGRLGRSRARNLGMRGADWYFFLDADDRIMPDAFELNDFSSPATFGQVCVEGKVLRCNIYPTSVGELKEMGAKGTLSMGFFCRGDLKMKFNETMNIAEDFDFYKRLPGFVKIRKPLVSIGRGPSAGGPRGYTKIDWIGECNKALSS